MSRVAKRPLNASAVSGADDQFYAAHPEMVDGATGSRTPLDASDPRQRALRGEWMDYYVANGGELEEPESEREPDSEEEPCPFADPQPTITARWTKGEVTPDHNSVSAPTAPASPPTDTIPDEAKVQLEVDTTEVPDGTAATIEIRNCQSDALVPEGTLSNLEVRGDRVVDLDSGDRPEWVFEAKHQPWDAWNAPFFYFKVVVDHGGLQAETPKDFNSQEGECLRVQYWHVCLSESSSLSGVRPECVAIKGILDGVGHSKTDDPDYTAGPTVALNIYGSHIRNTYVFHQASHGNLNNRATGASVNRATFGDPPDALPDPANWRGTVTFGPTRRFGDAEIGVVANIPSVPRYLWYSSTCLTGWNSSFADALIARGCRNVIAFRRTIPDAEAPELAKKIYRKWADTYHLDPERIPDCFFQYAGDYYDTMRPVLYGPGGGQATAPGGLSTGEIVAIAVAAVAVGVLVGVAVYALLK